MRRNAVLLPIAPAAPAGGHSPRFKILIFFMTFTLTFIVVRVWMLIVDTENVYLEIGGALITLIILYCLYLLLSRNMAAYRQQRALREGHRASSVQGEVDLDAVQLRIQLRRLYGDGVDVDTLLQQGLPWETINSCLRYFTYKEGACQFADGPVPISSRDIEESKSHDLRACTLASNREDSDTVTAMEVRDCAVCLCDFQDGDALVELPCKHAYHQACITEWLLTRNACPLCKQCVVKLADLRRIIDNMLDAQDFSGVSAVTAGSAESAHSTSSAGTGTGTGTGGSSVGRAGRLLISNLLRTAFEAEDRAAQLSTHSAHSLHTQSHHHSLLPQLDWPQEPTTEAPEPPVSASTAGVEDHLLVLDLDLELGHPGHQESDTHHSDSDRDSESEVDIDMIDAEGDITSPSSAWRADPLSLHTYRAVSRTSNISSSNVRSRSSDGDDAEQRPATVA